MALLRVVVLSNGLRTALAEYFTVEAQVSGCVAHPDHNTHPLDKCNSQNDPSGCTGGLDAANCYCVKVYGKGAYASSHEVAGGKDHTWSCSKDHENFCLGACDCLKKITCHLPKPKSVKFCMNYEHGCPGALPGTYFNIEVEDGYTESTSHTETKRIEITNTATAGAEAKLPKLLGGIGITGQDALGFAQVTETSWSQTHTASHKKTVFTHVECTKEVYYYSAKTSITMDDGSFLKLASGSVYLSLHKLKSPQTCVDYHPSESSAEDVAV